MSTRLLVVVSGSAIRVRELRGDEASICLVSLHGPSDLWGVAFRRLLFDAGWLRLYERQSTVRGRAVRWVYCSRRAESHNRGPDAVVVVPFVATTEGVKLLITKEHRIPLDGPEYGLPSGLIEPGESLEVSAARELEEETGYRMGRVYERSPRQLVSSAGLSDETFQFLFVEALPGGGQRLEASEEIEVLLCGLDELRALFEEPLAINGRLWPLCHGYLSQNSFPEYAANGVG